MKDWTKQRIDEYVVNECGGFALPLVEEFPFSEESLIRINNAYMDEENYTDSDVCDLVLELAYKEVEEM